VGGNPRLQFRLGKKDKKSNPGRGGFGNEADRKTERNEKSRAESGRISIRMIGFARGQKTRKKREGRKKGTETKSEERRLNSIDTKREGNSQKVRFRADRGIL